MPTLDALNFGPSGALRFASNQGRSISGEALGAIRYPSPFFDIAHTYLPTSFKTMLRWCRYYFLTNPLINAVCYKMAEYPVTDLVFDSENEYNNERWDRFFSETLHYKKFEVEAGLDYNTYGNTFISLYFPFHKLLTCKSCRCIRRIEQMKYIFREYKFVGQCPRCSYYGDFDVKDHYIRSPREIRLIRWNPEYITVQHNEATGENRYYYTIPPSMANDVRMAKRHIIERIPQVFIEALRKNKALLFSQQNIYHMQRPTIAQKDRGWGMPMILPVLKDTFYLQILRKAQEAIAIEHIVPMRILYPESGSGTADVYCVSLDTLVETRDGPLPASEVKTGEFLKTHSGAWKKVEAIADRPVPNDEKTFEFKVASLPAFPFTLSEEHPVYAAKKTGLKKGYDGIGEPDWVKAEDLKEGDFVLYPVGRKTWKSLDLDLSDYVVERVCTEKFVYRRLSRTKAEIYEYLEERLDSIHKDKHRNTGTGVPEFSRGECEVFLRERGWELNDWNSVRQAFLHQESIDRVPRYIRVTEDLAYLIGMYAAEGYSNEGSASFALNAAEIDIMDRLDSILESLEFGNPTRCFHTRDKGATYATNDVILGEFLKNSCGRGALNKKLPRFIMEAPDSIALSALSGLFKGDGCNINTETRRVGLETVSPSLAVGARQILLSMGYIPTVQKRTPSEDGFGKEVSYQFNVNGTQAEDLAGRFSWPVGARPRKNSVWSQCGFIRYGYVYLRVRSITERRVPTVRGFQIEGDKSFCVVGVATHNTTVNMTQWRDKIEQEIIRWRLDNNYIPILPIPVGQQTLGGDGRALMLSQEHRQWSEHIVAGMGVPIEFVFGGMQYSGSNVSMRILENHFLDVKTQRKQFVIDFIMPQVGAFMGWDPVPCHYKRFKMADDLQRSAFYLQLNQSGKLSDKSLLEDTDWDSVKEATRIDHERKSISEGQRRQALTQAAIQGEAQLIMAKYQMRGQKLMNELAMPPEQGLLPAEPMPGMGQSGMSPMAEGQMMNQEMGMMNRAGEVEPMEIPPAPPLPPEEGMAPAAPGMEGTQSQLATPAGSAQAGSYDLMSIAQKVVNWLNGMEDAERQHKLVEIQSNNPQLYSLILPMLQQTAGAQQNSAAAPTPEQRPARRGPEAAAL